MGRLAYDHIQLSVIQFSPNFDERPKSINYKLEDIRSPIPSKTKNYFLFFEELGNGGIASAYCGERSRNRGIEYFSHVVRVVFAAPIFAPFLAAAARHFLPAGR